MHGPKALLQLEMGGEEGPRLAAADSSTNGSSIDLFLFPHSSSRVFFPSPTQC